MQYLVSQVIAATLTLFSFAFSGPTQTDPPTVAISDLFPDGNFPLGEVVNYTDE
jgi:hypothetical protein